jgi:hypothetical protein
VRCPPSCPEQSALTQPLPAIHDTPDALTRLRAAERDAQQQPRVHARSLLQTPQARPRLPVARLLGVRRNPVGRGLAA